MAIKKTLRQILLIKKDDLEDDILSSLSDINLLVHSTPEELDSTKEKMDNDAKKLVRISEGVGSQIEKINRWLALLTDENEEQHKTAIFEEFPWAKYRYEKTNKEEN